MSEHEASRTLVKSAPELWEQCSDPAALARHLESFGEIRITKLEPQTAVAWEGDDVSGTVTLEPAGWGTRVILTATPADDQDGVGVVDEPAAAHDAPAAAPDELGAASDELAVEGVPDPEDEEAQPRPGLFARLFGRMRAGRAARAAVGPEPEPESESEPEPEPERATAPVPPPAPTPQASALLEALDSLGMAHHRPYSRG